MKSWLYFLADEITIYMSIIPSILMISCSILYVTTLLSKGKEERRKKKKKGGKIEGNHYLLNTYNLSCTFTNIWSHSHNNQWGRHDLFPCLEMKKLKLRNFMNHFSNRWVWNLVKSGPKDHNSSTLLEYKFENKYSWEYSERTLLSVSMLMWIHRPLILQES